MGRPGWLVRGIGALLVMVLLGACGSSAGTAATQSAAAATASAAATATAAAAGTPQQGGSVVYALGPQDINWYFPLRPSAYNTVVDSYAASLMYEPLFYVNSSGQIDYSRGVASKIAWNSDGTVYTVDLKPNFHWSDGTPVTASDVLFTWNLIKIASAKTATAPWPYAGAGSGGVPNYIKDVAVVSPTEFTVTLTQPVNQQWFEYDGLSKFIPLPSKAWDKYPSDPAQELAYITQHGTDVSFYNVVDGPFKMQSAVDKQAWTFVPNTAYDLHKPYLDKLVLAYETSDTAEVGDLRTGAVQVGYLPSTDYAIRDQLTADTFYKTNSYGYCRLYLNFTNPQIGPLLQQLPVRQAMQMGVDQAGIISKVYSGQAVPGVGPVPVDPPTFLDPKLISNPPYTFDVAAGKALLEKNGFTMQNGVMTDAKGQKLEFTMQYVSGNSATQTNMQLIQSDWAQEGIKIDLQPLQFADMIAMHVASDADKWQMQGGVCWVWGASVPTGENLFKTGGAYNFYKFSDPALDKLIDATVAPQPSAQAQQDAMYAYDDAVGKDLPQIWMPHPYGFGEVAKNVHGVMSTVNNFSGTISPEYWWVSR
ncbi:MAG TPA: peptide ABC transporter substrate-binding protein [Bacillota bacterium]|nr:peptide ABC transporter substrate-binding protein [Bacillota bacterium]